MDSDMSVLALLLILLVPFGLFASYQAGKRAEAKYWTNAIPKQMTALCEECAGLTR